MTSISFKMSAVLALVPSLITLVMAKETCEENGVGTTYVRWGRTECPDTAKLVYQGVVGKGFYSHSGGGTNYICLYGNPEWADVPVGDFQHHSYIYGVEYENVLNLHDKGAPCAVCHVKGRSAHLMIPAKRSCPMGWTEEYFGMLVSERYNHQSATFECLDSDPEVVPNSASNENGGLFYRVEAACGHSLSCPPFVQGYEVPCIVCTR